MYSPYFSLYIFIALTAYYLILRSLKVRYSLISWTAFPVGYLFSAPLSFLAKTFVFDNMNFFSFIVSVAFGGGGYVFFNFPVQTQSSIRQIVIRVSLLLFINYFSTTLLTILATSFCSSAGLLSPTLSRALLFTGIGPTSSSINSFVLVFRGDGVVAYLLQMIGVGIGFFLFVPMSHLALGTPIYYPQYYLSTIVSFFITAVISVGVFMLIIAILRVVDREILPKAFVSTDRNKVDFLIEYLVFIIAACFLANLPGAIAFFLRTVSFFEFILLCLFFITRYIFLPLFFIWIFETFGIFNLLGVTSRSFGPLLISCVSLRSDSLGMVILDVFFSPSDPAIPSFKALLVMAQIFQYIFLPFFARFYENHQGG